MNAMGLKLFSFLLTAMAVTTRSAATEGENDPEEQEQQVALQPPPQPPQRQPPQPVGQNEEASTSSGPAAHHGVLPQTVKMPVKAKEDGSNLPMWKKALFAACVAKGCLPAIKSPLPGELEDFAALMLIFFQRSRGVALQLVQYRQCI